MYILIFELLCEVRSILGLGWIDLASRVRVDYHRFNGFAEVPVICIDVRNIMFNGIRHGQCHHGGQCPDASRRQIRIHGTNALHNLLSPQYRGFQLPATRTLVNCSGWYHFPADMWWRALEYAPPHRLGSGSWRCLCEYDCRCWNSCGGARGWSYTQAECTRYCLSALWFVPEEACNGIRLL